ncbi:helix-turn-helix transcriptional regulator [Flammeovirga aprica]|uniref:Helix-turn-helix transcriptional regulator n=1 Tax=Flammeovirga aprica JL-4 TaxID=694437 RepID=A0A7X9P3E6_9BACT|nr:AraC family transcriptional regulator [Flammeovirga aprica]NME68710.1 helix-turn-helix transcriptional regulator [Flammeovirga aprica JL-4]
MEIDLKEGSASQMLEQVYNHLGGELSAEKYEVKKDGIHILSHVFSLVKGTDIMIHSIRSNEDLYYNIEGDESDERYLNFRFEYKADIMKNTEDHEEGMDLQAVGMAVYDTSYSFKTHNKGGQLNQWISIRISIQQMSDIFTQFGKYLGGLFPEGHNWVRYDIAPLEVHLLLKDIFDLDLDQRNPMTHSVVLARVIECLGVFYDRLLNKGFQEQSNVHPDDLQRLMELKDKLINPFEPLPSLSVIADEYGYSLSKLKRDFGSVFGSSIKRFHTDLRLEKAKELLQHEKRSITEVARLVGYNSVSKFSLGFKKAYGITPKEASLKYTKN